LTRFKLKYTPKHKKTPQNTDVFNMTIFKKDLNHVQPYTGNKTLIDAKKTVFYGQTHFAFMVKASVKTMLYSDHSTLIFWPENIAKHWLLSAF